jgi:AAA domain
VSAQRPDHALTADQQRLVETIVGSEHTRLLVIGPPGTGKTYTVPVAVNLLIQRVPDIRALILAPAALCALHVAMLADRLKDAIPVVRVAGKSDCRIQEQAAENGWKPGVYVMSLDLARQMDIAASLAASAWDLVVVDEAHMLSGTRADLVAQLAADERVRSLVLLSVLPLQDRRLTDGLSVVRWKRVDAGHSSRVRAVISYERTTAEQELYARLIDFLDVHSSRDAVRIRFERAWRSSVIALEQVILRERTTLRANNKGPVGAGRRPLSDPLVLSEPAIPEGLADAATAWSDPTAAATAMDGLLRDISSLSIDSKLEALLAAINHRRSMSETIPCVVTEMRESAGYIAQALESHQQLSELVDGKRTIAFDREVGADGTVAVATDLGLKGIELAANTVISYELPRSRLRIEQRWGRIDRVGREQRATMIALQDVSGVDPVEHELLRMHGFAGARA